MPALAPVEIRVRIPHPDPPEGEGWDAGWFEFGIHGSKPGERDDELAPAVEAWLNAGRENFLVAYWCHPEYATVSCVWSTTKNCWGNWT